jgi:hypothetical protein
MEAVARYGRNDGRRGVIDKIDVPKCHLASTRRWPPFCHGEISREEYLHGKGELDD